MKNANYKKPCLYALLLRSVFTLLIVVTGLVAKSSPTIPAERQIAFNRAKKLDNGISISWLEQTWNNNVLATNAIKPADLQLLGKLGFRTLRLPVAFTYFEDKKIALNDVLKYIDDVWGLCRRYKFNLIIDYHYGNINDQNFNTATASVIKTWQQLAQHYLKADHEGLYFEIYNEPPPISTQVWKDAAYNIVTGIRKIDRNRTLLVGASNYNSIYELSRFVRLQDENIIYTFHFYEPFLFTHQGAEWIGDQVATTGVPFPYNAQKFPQLNSKAKNTAGEQNYNKYNRDGNEQSVHDKIQIVKNWKDKYVVPVICSEYGSYNKYADVESRCRYVKTVRHELKVLGISGILWDYNSNFSIFSGPPSVANLPACMQDAIGYNGQ